MFLFLKLVKNTHKAGNIFCLFRFQFKKAHYICAMDEKKLEILEKAAAVFMRLGIKSVTMDEMATQLGMQVVN